MLDQQIASPPPVKGAQYTASELAAFRAFYVENGVVKVPGLVTPEWVDALMNVVSEVRRRNTEKAPLGQVEVREAPGRVTIRWMWREFETAQRFFTDAGVQDTVAAILGAKRLQYWFDLTFIHEHGSDAEGSPWHHDIAAFPFSGEQIPSLWIAMSDVPLTMAPLQCIKGSHRNPTMFRPPVYIDPNTPIPDGYAEMPDVDALIASGEYQMLQWPMKKGDAFVIHPNTIHGSPPCSLEGVTRVAFTTRWAGDDVVWKPNAFSMEISGLDYATVPVGERPSGERFPYAKLSNS